MPSIETNVFLNTKTVLYSRFTREEINRLPNKGSLPSKKLINGKPAILMKCLPKEKCEDKTRRDGTVDNARCIYCGKYRHLTCLFKPTPQDHRWATKAGFLNVLQSTVGVCIECHRSRTSVDHVNQGVAVRAGWRCACSSSIKGQCNSCLHQRYDICKNAYCIECSRPVHAACADFEALDSSDISIEKHVCRGWWFRYPKCLACLDPKVPTLKSFTFPSPRVSGEAFETLLLNQAGPWFLNAQHLKKEDCVQHSDLVPVVLGSFDIDRLTIHDVHLSDSLIDFYLTFHLRITGRYQQASPCFVFPYGNGGMSTMDQVVYHSKTTDVVKDKILPYVKRTCFPRQWRKDKGATGNDLSWPNHVPEDFYLVDSDVIVFVVHTRNHYALWLACNAQTVLEEDPKANEYKPFLASLDSLVEPGTAFSRGPKNHIVYAILNCASWYLSSKMEGGDTQDIETLFNMKTMPIYRIEGPPVQTDSSSCGPLTLLNYHGLMCLAFNKEKIRFKTHTDLASYYSQYWETLVNCKPDVVSVLDVVVYFRSEMKLVVDAYVAEYAKEQTVDLVSPRKGGNQDTSTAKKPEAQAIAVTQESATDETAAAAAITHAATDVSAGATAQMVSQETHSEMKTSDSTLDANAPEGTPHKDNDKEVLAQQTVVTEENPPKLPPSDTGANIAGVRKETNTDTLTTDNTTAPKVTDPKEVNEEMMGGQTSVTDENPGKEPPGPTDASLSGQRKDTPTDTHLTDDVGDSEKKRSKKGSSHLHEMRNMLRREESDNESVNTKYINDMAQYNTCWYDGGDWHQELHARDDDTDSMRLERDQLRTGYNDMVDDLEQQKKDLDKKPKAVDDDDTNPKTSVHRTRWGLALLRDQIANIDREASEDESIDTKLRKDIIYHGEIKKRMLELDMSDFSEDTEAISNGKREFKRRIIAKEASLHPTETAADRKKAARAKGKEAAASAAKEKEAAASAQGTSRGKKLPMHPKKRPAEGTSASPSKKGTTDIRTAFGDIIENVRRHTLWSMAQSEKRFSERELATNLPEKINGKYNRKWLGSLLVGLDNAAYSVKLKEIKGWLAKEKEEEDEVKNGVVARSKEKKSLLANLGGSEAHQNESLKEYYKEATADMIANPPGPKVISKAVKEIAKLMFIPSRPAEEEGYFYPSYYNAKNAAGKVTEGYTKAWIYYCFDATFARAVQHYPEHWHDVPIGNREQLPETITPGLGPPLFHPQGDRSTCVFNSMACALAYLGRKNAANALVNLALGTPNMTGKQVIEALSNAMIEYAPDIGRGEKWRKRSKKIMEYDPVKQTSPFPTLLQLMGNDGGVQHAVTTVDEWIFDSVEKHAIPLSHANLGRCCGTELGFARVFAAYRFERK